MSEKPEPYRVEQPPRYLIDSSRPYFNPAAEGDYALLYRFVGGGKWGICAALSEHGIALRKTDGRSVSNGHATDRCLVLTAGDKLTPFADYFAEQHRERLAAGHRCAVCGHRADAPYLRRVHGRLAEHCADACHRPFARESDAVAFLGRYDGYVNVTIREPTVAEANPWHE